MAREEHDREDLLREATALVERVELRVPHESEPVVIGFRRDGAASFFFGADPVFQFTAAGELRRAFVDGKLLKAERGRLIELTRVRTPAETQLIRNPWNDSQTAELCESMKRRLAALREALHDAVVIVGQVPPDRDLLPRCITELSRLGTDLRIAASPRVG